MVITIVSTYWTSFRLIDVVDADQSYASPPSVVKSSPEDVQSEPVTPVVTDQLTVHPSNNGSLKIENLEGKNDPMHYPDCPLTQFDIDQINYDMVRATDSDCLIR